MSSNGANLTIGAVASETDVSVAVLRSWELRYGFPTPVRLPSGHRRYTAEHVAQIRQVVRDRDGGLSLDAATARARSQAQRLDPSMFAGLRRRRPDLPVHVLSRRGMLAVSRAIEDECCSRADHSVLIGSFQHARAYRRSESRWRELGRTAEATIVFADFPTSCSPTSKLHELAVPGDDPLLREWAVVCDAGDAAACLTGIERAGEPGRFEALWSADPAVVREAAATGVALARRIESSLDITFAARPSTDDATTVARTGAVANRIIAYLDA